MNRRQAGTALAALAALFGIALAAGSSVRNSVLPLGPDAELSPDAGLGNSPASAPPPKPRVAAPPPVTSDTPMAQRVAVIGMLNKRNGLARDVAMRPGDVRRFGDLAIRLRACETTADWEPEQLTGAFVQAWHRERDGTWKGIFSGWLYKESPSLNVVQSALYDVWPKSCAMRHPDSGPETVSVSPSSPARSIAKKSAAAPDADPPADAAPSPSAASNSTT